MFAASNATPGQVPNSLSALRATLGLGVDGLVIDAEMTRDGVLAGGHTVTDSEIKYGLSVTGTIDPNRVLANGGAKPGDALVLTKKLGMGAISTGIKKGKVPEDIATAAMDQMATLNRDASEAALAAESVCVTDVTGFGLLGHACEIAEASGVSI